MELIICRKNSSIFFLNFIVRSFNLPTLSIVYIWELGRLILLAGEKKNQQNENWKSITRYIPFKFRAKKNKQRPRIPRKNLIAQRDKCDYSMSSSIHYFILLSRLTFPVMKKQDVPNTFKRKKWENNINGKFSKDAPLFSDDSLVKSIIVWDIFH